jgi:hypothetical protein
MKRCAGICVLSLLGFAGPLLAAPPAGAPKGPAGSYIDERHLTALAFGTHSHWIQPWRAHQETLPVKQFLDAQGVVLDHLVADAPDR